MVRVKNKINAEIAHEQCGFVEGKGVTHAINTFRTKLNELWENKQMYICASLTTLADIVRHDKIITQLTQLKIDRKDLRVIKTMYWEKTAAM